MASLDVDAMLERFRERAKAVKQRPLPRSPARSVSSSSPRRSSTSRTSPSSATPPARSRTACSFCGSTSPATRQPGEGPALLGGRRATTMVTDDPCRSTCSDRPRAGRGNAGARAVVRRRPQRSLRRRHPAWRRRPGVGDHGSSGDARLVDDGSATPLNIWVIMATVGSGPGGPTRLVSHHVHSHRGRAGESAW